MNSRSIVHFCTWDKKFVIPFIELIKNTTDGNKHLFIINGSSDEYIEKKYVNIKFYDSIFGNLRHLRAISRYSDKIILHGAFNNKLLLLLLLTPGTLSKTFWIIWGGDLYTRNYNQQHFLKFLKREIIRKCAISKFGHIVTHVRGDYELAIQWYGSKAKWHECFVYPSNLFTNRYIPQKSKQVLNILVGNSAYPSNNHIEVLNMLKQYVEEDIHIICPLSYGNEEYAKNIASFGCNNFGNKFTALNDFINKDEYNRILNDVDIALFNHNRQQAMGNIVSLLGIGKTVYLRKEVTTWEFCERMGLKVYDIQKFNLDMITKQDSLRNMQLISRYFSMDHLVKQLKNIHDA